MEALTPSSPARTFVATWRALQEDGAPAGLDPVTVALAGSFTVEPMLPYLGCFLAQRGLFPSFVLAPYNQIYQGLLDPASALHQAAAPITVVLPRAEDLYPRALQRLAGLDPAEIEDARAQAHAEIGRLCEALGHFERATSGTLLCGTLPPALTTPLGVLDASHPASQEALRCENNLRLWQHARSSSRTRLFDQAEVVTRHGTARSYDDRMWAVSRCPYSDQLLRLLAEHLCRTITPLLRPPAKVVVLDLDDNTLWGGIVGEDGPAGIAVGETGVGGAFAAFQEALLALRSQGVLLCLASKNDEADAFEIFDRHPGMRLRREHLSAWRVNWRPKSESLRELSQELSLGLDSFVFIDDSPTECEEVRRMLPQVSVLRLPEDPAHYVTALRGVPALDRMLLTAEDRGRAEHYQRERDRVAARPPVDSPDPQALRSYLQSLELRVTVSRLGKDHVPRAAQLTQKTNQFNLTTIRRAEAEVEALRTGPAWRAYVAEVSDRFGDYGLTGLLFAQQDPADQTVFSIDTLLLSCRVLGRGVETALFSVVLSDLRRAGARLVLGRFVPTGKNAPASAFLPGHGFSEGPGGRFVLEVPKGEDPGDPPVLECSHLQVVFSDSRDPQTGQGEPAA